MTVRFGKFSALVNPWHSLVLRDISLEEQKKVEYSLDKLAEILTGDFEWTLTGGLAIPTTIGSFYRVHNDIDIGVSEKDVKKLVACAKARGYALVSRTMMVKIPGNKKIDVYKEILPEEAVDKTCRHTRLVRLEPDGRIARHAQLLDYFDVYIHHYGGDMLVSRDGRIKISSCLRGAVYTTISGRSINVRPLHYTLQLKLKRNGEKDRCDLEKLFNSGSLSV